MSEKQHTPGKTDPPLPLGNRGGAMGAIQKPKNLKKTAQDLLAYLGAYKITIVAAFLLAAGSSLLAVLGPKILGKATTKVYEGAMSKANNLPNAAIDFSYIGYIILILLVLYAVSAIFVYVQGFFMAGVAQRVSYNMRKAIAEKINRLPLRYFDTNSYGDILSRVTNDVDTVSNTLNQSLSSIIASVTTVIGVLIMMLSINWLMTLVSLVLVPLSFFIVQMIVKRSQRHFVAQQSSLGKLNGHVEEMYGGHSIVKAFNGEEQSMSSFDKYNTDLYAAAWKSQFLSGLLMPVMGFVGNLGYVAVAILGGWLAIQKAITVGDIQAFIQYVRSFTQPLSQTAQIAGVLQSTFAAAERVFEFLDEEEEVSDSVHPVKLDKVVGAVSFRNVSFGYSPAKTVINNFSAEIKPGQRVAIVGPTGAGKTTLVKLLMRFYETNGGGITVDGHDIRDFTRADLRRIFGMVLQDAWLFNGTIMENIRYGNLAASNEQVFAAAKAAHVEHFIRSLPGGYNMELNEEVSNISQGQMQLLTIARAILADPQILILDEATSSVDTRTEVLIQKAMERLMQGRTSFIIAHRLSTIRDADVILVMDKGDIVEQGTHEELMQRGGFYASLYNSQFERI